MLKDCIEVYDDVFTPEECKNIIHNIDEMTEKSIMTNEKNREGKRNGRLLSFAIFFLN